MKCYVCKKNKERWGDTLLIISGKARNVCLKCYQLVREYYQKKEIIKCISCENTTTTNIGEDNIFICKDCLREGLIKLALEGDKQAKLILSKNSFGDEDK